MILLIPKIQRLLNSRQLVLVSLPRQAAFTFIEIIIVISLIALVVSVAAPNLGLIQDVDESNKLLRLNQDIRSAFDLSVLTGEVHRLVFSLGTGEYWLEKAVSTHFYLADAKVDRELSAEELKEELEIFEEQFVEYEKAAGQEIKDPETGQPIRPASPVVKAKAKLAPPQWEVVESLEWKKRDLGPDLFFDSLQTARHTQPQTFEDLGKEALVALYFFPQGFVEKAIIKMRRWQSTDVIDEEFSPVLIGTRSYEGVGFFLESEEEIVFDAWD